MRDDNHLKKLGGRRGWMLATSALLDFGLWILDRISNWMISVYRGESFCKSMMLGKV